MRLATTWMDGQTTSTTRIHFNGNWDLPERFIDYGNGFNWNTASTQVKNPIVHQVHCCCCCLCIGRVTQSVCVCVGEYSWLLVLLRAGRLLWQAVTYSSFSPAPTCAPLQKRIIIIFCAKRGEDAICLDKLEQVCICSAQPVPSLTRFTNTPLFFVFKITRPAEFIRECSYTRKVPSRWPIVLKFWKLVINNFVYQIP